MDCIDFSIDFLFGIIFNAPWRGCAGVVKYRALEADGYSYFKNFEIKWNEAVIFNIKTNNSKGQIEIDFIPYSDSVIPEPTKTKVFFRKDDRFEYIKLTPKSTESGSR